MSALEQKGWRDEAFSSRHREYGHSVPMMDVDFLCVEYNYFLPVAVVDYKLGNASGALFFSGSVPKTLMPLVALANAASIPALVVQYWPNKNFAYRPQALNAAAVKMIRCRSIGDTVPMTETEWVATLYELRGNQAVADYVRKTRTILNRTTGRTTALGNTPPETPRSSEP